MKVNLASAQALEKLDQLFQQCGQKDEELIQYVQALALENEQLQRNIMKLRSNASTKSHTISSMHTKLTDALRE